MNTEEVQAGKQLWRRTGNSGRLAQSSFDAEASAPKTWILYANSKGEEIRTIECELYVVGRQSDSQQAVVMLHGMCPKCGETFLAREDNKTMNIDRVVFRQAPKFLQINWDFHCRNNLGRLPRDNDRIAIVSSPERWACDYCHSWCVKVHGGVARDDLSGTTQVIVHGRPHMIKGEGKEKVSSGEVDF
jgi:ribosomal protein S27AE